jgi:hypothetical protein
MYHSSLTTAAAYFLLSHVLVAIPLPECARTCPALSADRSASLAINYSTPKKVSLEKGIYIRLRIVTSSSLRGSNYLQLHLTSCSRKLFHTHLLPSLNQ